MLTAGKEKGQEPRSFKTIRYWVKDRHIDQQNRIENPKMDEYKYGQLIFEKGTMAI